MTAVRALSILLLFVVIQTAWGDATPAAPHLEVHGHRGARARFPENTLPAFEYAIRAGVDYIELDLAITQDNLLVVSHSPHVNSDICLGPNGTKITQEPLIHSLPLAALEKYDCGAIKNPDFPMQTPVPNTRIPTLDEVFGLARKLEAAGAKAVRFNVEMKVFSRHPEYTVSPQEFARLLAAKLREWRMLDRVMVESFDYPSLAEFHKLEPHVPLSAIVAENTFASLNHVIDVTGAQFISPDYRMVSVRNVRQMHARGVKVLPWSPDKPEIWQKLIDMGVDGIITDDPAALLAITIHKR